MKTPKTIITLLAAMTLASCSGQTNKRTSDMGNTIGTATAIPENTLSVIQAGGRTIYLTEIHRIPVERKMYPKDSWYGQARHDRGGDFVSVSFIDGDYPAAYTQQLYFLHLAGDETSGPEVWLDRRSVFRNGEMVSQSGGGTENGRWEPAADILWAEIAAYYMENANGKSQK